MITPTTLELSADNVGRGGIVRRERRHQAFLELGVLFVLAILGKHDVNHIHQHFEPPAPGDR